MKHFKARIVIVSLLLTVGKVWATDLNVGANALAGSASFSNGGSVGNVNSGVTQNQDFSDLRIVPPAIAPSVSTNVICPIVQAGSVAGSIFLFSGGKTTSPEINAICLAYHQSDKELIHAIACADSSSYRKASERLGRSCK